MRIVSNAVLIVSGVYLALGLVYLRFWWAERVRLPYLAFAISCLACTVFAGFELGMMHAATPEEYLFYAWWAFFPGSVSLVSFAWFTYLHLHGRRWLFLSYGGLRILPVVLHLIWPSGINFLQVTAVVGRNVLGETISYPIAVRNPWMALPHLSHVLLIIFFLDTSIRCWRRGERQQALIFGTGTMLFGTTVLFFALSVLWGLVSVPIVASFSVLFVLAPMLYELNLDMHRAAMLSRQLEERDARLTESLDQLQLSAAAANVGLWTRKVGEEKVWLSGKAADVWGFPEGQLVRQEDVIQHIHPADRERYIANLQELDDWKNSYQLEYRILSDDGNIRWIYSRGTAETLNDYRLIRGAIVDITKLKMAEAAIRDLTGKVMNAQEKERARLARELHDDLSQSIALLSIRLATLRNEPKDLAYVRDQLNRFVSDVESLSVNVRRISHELHPARLIHLGLETSLREFCRELSATHSLEIEFAARDLPRDLPPDVSLCLYRVAQESLQNVIKHSGTAMARVDVRSGKGEVRLSVSDTGKGFDLSEPKAKGSLGLISIDERVRAVDGEVNVISAVGAGTAIEVHVPLSNTNASIPSANQ